MNEITTKGDLARLGMDALDRDRVGQVAVVAGGVSFASALEVMEFAKLISTGGSALPAPFRNNPGMCLAVTLQAIGWRMDPVAVMNKSYVVNDRIGFESQLVHAVVERRAPLKKRLDCAFDGEGPERTCKVTGVFSDGEVRTYESPPLRKAKKKSPLWDDDPDQQLFYFATRAWARRWVPDVLMGIYTRDELADNPVLGREEEPADLGLKARLAGSKVGEGHQDGHAEAELAKLSNGDGEYQTIETVALPASEAQTAPGEAAQGEETAPGGGQAKGRVRKRAQAAPEAESAGAATGSEPGPKAAKTKAKAGAKTEAPAQVQAEPEPPKVPTTAAEYTAYCEAWMATEDECASRWEQESEMRNELRVPIKERHRLMQLIAAKTSE